MKIPEIGEDEDSLNKYYVIYSKIKNREGKEINLKLILTLCKFPKQGIVYSLILYNKNINIQNKNLKSRNKLRQ